LLAPAHGGSWPVLFCSFMSFDWVHLSTPRLGLCTNFGGPQIIAESCFLVPVCALGAGNSAALHFLLSFFSWWCIIGAVLADGIDICIDIDILASGPRCAWEDWAREPGSTTLDGLPLDNFLDPNF